MYTLKLMRWRKKRAQRRLPQNDLRFLSISAFIISIFGKKSKNTPNSIPNQVTSATDIFLAIHLFVCFGNITRRLAKSIRHIIFNPQYLLLNTRMTSIPKCFGSHFLLQIDFQFRCHLRQLCIGIKFGFRIRREPAHRCGASGWACCMPMKSSTFSANQLTNRCSTENVNESSADGWCTLLVNSLELGKRNERTNNEQQQKHHF